MSRTVTGTYILRPTSYYSYLSSGTFSDYFATSPSEPGSWKTKMSMTTQIGDNSDSTYYADTGVTSGNSNAENALMTLTCPAGGVPDHAYTITKVSLNYRAQSSAQTDGYRKLNLWFSIWNTGNGSTPAAALSASKFAMKVGYSSSSSLHTSESSISTKTYNITSLTNPTMEAGKFTNRMAICAQAYKTGPLISFSWWRLYDVWFEVSYTYTEDEVKTYVYTDAGCNITGDATIPADSNKLLQTYVEDYAGETKTLTANVATGYEFDGWYLNGTKVSDDLTYTVTVAASAQLYAICYIRQLFVGTEQVQAVYAGTTETDVYVGTTKIFGESLIKADATAVG